MMKQYKTNHCKDCPARDLCTKNPKGRVIERSEHAPYIEQNRLNIEANRNIYKRRQAIVEHPFGIIKRHPIAIGWGFYYIMTKRGIKRASADVGLIFTAFNLRRIINIVDKNALIKFLKELAFLFIGIFTSSKEFCCSVANSFLRFIILVINFNHAQIGSK
jgi:hypothetical protein